MEEGRWRRGGVRGRERKGRRDGWRGERGGGEG